MIKLPVSTCHLNQDLFQYVDLDGLALRQQLLPFNNSDYSKFTRENQIKFSNLNL